MQTLVTKLGLKERSFHNRRARIFILFMSSVWIFLTISSLPAGNGTFQDFIGLLLATGMVLFVAADFPRERSGRLALSLRMVAVLPALVAFVALVIRAASVIGIL